MKTIIKLALASASLLAIQTPAQALPGLNAAKDTINKVEKNDAALQKALQTKKDAAADAVNSAKKAAEAKKTADTKALQDKLDAAKDAVDAKKATDTKALQDKANAVNAAVKALKE